MILKGRYFGITLLLLVFNLLRQVYLRQTNRFVTNFENVSLIKRKGILYKGERKWKRKKRAMFLHPKSRQNIYSQYAKIRNKRYDKSTEDSSNSRSNRNSKKHINIIPFHSKMEHRLFTKYTDGKIEESITNVADKTIKDLNNPRKIKDEIDDLLTGDKTKKTNSNEHQHNTNVGNRRRYYKFKSWNNTKEINRFDIGKYEAHNEIENNNDTTQKYHSAYYSFISSNNSNETNHSHIKINKELVNASSIEELLKVLRKYEDQENTKNKQGSVFNEVNIVTAYHRIAKHLKNRNVCSKVKEEEKGQLMDTYFDNVTSSLFENYSDWVKLEETEKNKETGNARNVSVISSNSSSNSSSSNSSSSNSNTSSSGSDYYNQNKDLEENGKEEKKVKKENYEDEEIILNDATYYNHNSLCKIKIYRYIYELLKRDLENRDGGIVTKHIANIAWASAILENNDPDIWTNIKIVFYEKLFQFKAQELSIILWSFSAMNKEYIETKNEFIILYKCIKKYAREKKFKAQEFSNIIWSFGISKYCNQDIIILLYNYALTIFDKLLLKDISTVLYSLSVFASDATNQDILEVIKKKHFELYNLDWDYLTIKKTETENANIFSFDNMYHFPLANDDDDDSGYDGYDRNDENDSAKESYSRENDDISVKMDHSKKKRRIDEEKEFGAEKEKAKKNNRHKKYIFFLLFENFLNYSLKKINNEKEKMTLRDWANIFWSCANIGLGIYKDKLYDTEGNIKYYIYEENNIMINEKDEEKMKQKEKNQEDKKEKAEKIEKWREEDFHENTMEQKEHILYYKKRDDSFYSFLWKEPEAENFYPHIVYKKRLNSKMKNKDKDGNEGRNEENSKEKKKQLDCYSCHSYYKPYVHVINKEYIFPAMAHLKTKVFNINSEGKKQQKKNESMGLNVDLDIYNDRGNILVLENNTIKNITRNAKKAEKAEKAENKEVRETEKKESPNDFSPKENKQLHNLNESVNFNDNASFKNNEMKEEIHNSTVEISNSSKCNKELKYESIHRQEGLTKDIDMSKFLNDMIKETEDFYYKANNSHLVFELVKLFEYHLDQKIINWKTCEIQSIANVLWSLSILNVFPKKIFESALSQCNKRFLKNLKIKDDVKKKKTNISPLHQSQLYQSSLSFCLYLLHKDKNIKKKMESQDTNYPHSNSITDIDSDESNVSNTYGSPMNIRNEDTLKKIQFIFKNYFNVSLNCLHLWKKQLARNQRKEEKNQISSSVHKKISGELKKLNVFHYNEYFIFDAILVDIYIPHLKIIIEIDGPSHFFQKGEDILYKPKCLFKKRLLRALGYVVISISITNSTFMFSNLNTIDFIKNALKKVNYTF